VCFIKIKFKQKKIKKIKTAVGNVSGGVVFFFPNFQSTLATAHKIT
jgi:hypothetical protein